MKKLNFMFEAQKMSKEQMKNVTGGLDCSGLLYCHWEGGGFAGNIFGTCGVHPTPDIQCQTFTGDSGSYCDECDCTG